MGFRDDSRQSEASETLLAVIPALVLVKGLTKEAMQLHKKQDITSLCAPQLLLFEVVQVRCCSHLGSLTLSEQRLLPLRMAAVTLVQ